MGIRGLQSYIKQCSEQYLEPYELHNTELVIDGNGIAHKLCERDAGRNCEFGGDYDKFAKCVGKFFDNLSKCKITPIVLIDGGRRHIKANKTDNHLEPEILTKSESQKKKFFPLLMLELFKDVMDEKKVRYAQCTFKADNEIAAVAESRKCPVLSNDSDFFVYDVLYIPYFTLNNRDFQSQTHGSVTKCKIFRINWFLNSFGILDRYRLRLAAPLLGNNYIVQSAYEEFFKNLELPEYANKKTPCEEHQRITALLQWLETNDKASTIKKVLSSIQNEDQRENLRKKIEAIIECYSISRPSMLDTLGFSEEDIAGLKSKGVGHQKDDEEINNKADSLSRTAPRWFIDQYRKGKFPSYFINMMQGQLYYCQPQIEDYSLPAAETKSLTIVSVIFELLLSNKNNVDKKLGCVKRYTDQRSENSAQLPSCTKKFPFQFPSLENLNQLPVGEKIRILERILEIPQEDIAEHVLPQWSLYLISIVYWAKQKGEPSVTDCHVYSLVYAMLFDIIDKKLGYRYRSLKKFKTKYKSQIDEIIADGRRPNPAEAQNASNINIRNIYKSVTVNECLVAAGFFIPKFNTHPNSSNSKSFTIIHSFAQFQCCLKHIMHLNALFGYPMAQTKVAEIYNGTLLYNLYNEFESKKDVEAYMKAQLRSSPTLLKLIDSLLNLIKKPLAKVFGNKGNRNRNRTKRNDNKDRNLVSNLQSNNIYHILRNCKTE